MNRSSEESQKRVAYGISGALLVLIALGYLFVPRADLQDRSPISVLASPDKSTVFRCVGDLTLTQRIEVDSREDCDRYFGIWQKAKASDGFNETRGRGWSDVGSLIGEDLLSMGGLGLLIGASPAIGFLLFQRFRGREMDQKLGFPPLANGSGIEKRLKNIQDLHKQGLITSEEFKIKKKELLDEI
jgi:hypothetical protein